MTTRPWRTLLGTALATSLLAVAACTGTGGGSGSSEKEKDMTPDEALGRLQEAAAGLLAAAAPGNEATELPPRRDIPCGGPGGNERTKVKHSYAAGAGIVDDAEAALDAAQARLTGLGLSDEGRNQAPVGPTLSFSGEGFRGDLLVRSSGAIQVRAATDCLDNPAQ